MGTSFPGVLAPLYRGTFVPDSVIGTVLQLPTKCSRNSEGVQGRPWRSTEVMPLLMPGPHQTWVLQPLCSRTQWWDSGNDCLVCLNKVCESAW